MAFQPAPNTVQALIGYLMDDIPVSNVLNFQMPSGYVQADLDALSELVDQWVHDSIIPNLSNGIVYQRTEVKGLEALVDLISVNDTNGGDIGAGGARQANNVAKAFTLRSGFTGRSARGRIFLGGIDTSWMTSTNHVSQAFVDEIIEALEALIDLANAIGWFLVIVSRYTGGVKRATAVNYLVTSVGVSDLTVDSMKGRLK